MKDKAIEEDVATSFNGIAGRLTIQTLELTGRKVNGLLPIISKISISSIKVATQAVAAVKAKIYEKGTVVSPKIFGFEFPGECPEVIRALIAELYNTEE